MISKFSVKRPYTVLVGVVAILVIGIVAMTRMTMDLLPDMTLPYVIVITTDPGASPSEVEQQVTSPLESALATTSNLENIQSVSYNSYSTIILEYTQTTNMDSTMIEIQQSLDQVTSYLPDTVGSPLVMQISPDMIPIMVAAVTVEGESSVGTADYVKSDVIPQLEGVEGVASVTSSGSVTETIQVTLNQDKIDTLNKKIKDAIDDQFLEAEAELIKGKDELESGKNQLESGKEQMAGQLAAGQTELATQKVQLYATAADLDQNLMVLNAAKSLLEGIVSTVNGLTDTAADLKTQIESLQSLIGMVDNGLITAEQFLEANGMDIDTARERLNSLEESLRGIYAQIRTAVEPVAAQYDIDISGLSDERLNEFFNNAGRTLDGAETALERTEEGLGRAEEGVGVAAGYIDLSPVITGLTSALTQVNVGIETIKAAQSQINAGKLQLNDAAIMLSRNQILGELELANAEAQLMMGESAMTQAEQTLDSAKEEAEKAADLNSILSLDVVNGLLVAQNFDMPAGYAGDYLIRVGEDISDIDALRELILIDIGMDGIDTIRLKDIADVELVDDSADVYAKVNGSPALLLTFDKQTGYSTGDVTDRILDRFDILERNLDKKTSFSVLMDQGVYIDIIVKSIVQNMLLGAALAIIILIIFLRDIKPTIIIACAIPLSVVFAVVLMYFSGITLNIISMSGLTLGIGMLVDNSIVVIENIYRMKKEEGMSIRKAAVYGASQVAGAITASTLTTICVFLPIVFTDGLTRQLFVDMGLTIAYTLTASLIVALTLVPAMAQGLLKKSEDKAASKGKFYDIFGKVLEGALRIKPVIFIIVIGLLVAGVFLALSRGTAFMPEMTSTQVTVTLAAPDDEERSFEEMTEYSDTLMGRITEIKDVETVGAMMGSGSALSSFGASSGNSVTMYILLNEKTRLSNEEVKERILAAAEDLDCDVTVDTALMDMSLLTGSGVSVQIKGRNLDTLASLAEEVADRIDEIEGITDIDDGLGNMTDEFLITVDKAKAAEYGMTVAQVFQLVAGELSDTRSMTSLSTDLKDYNVYVNTDDQADVTIDDIRRLTFDYTDRMSGETETVKISDIASFIETSEMSSIQRDAQVRYVEVTASLEEGYNVGLVGREVTRKLSEINVPEGYSVKTTGEDEVINEAMEQVLLMLILAVILIYLIMVAQFQSLLSPFIIMFTIPLAFTGGFFALYLSGSEVSIIAMIGFVMLSGIIVNNGIVLVDYINQLRREGWSKKDAIIESSKTRLRPVLMTALTTIISMSTMALGMGQGTEMSQPMAIVVVGGMVYGTLLTLVVVPCIYDVFNKEKDMTEEEL